MKFPILWNFILLICSASSDLVSSVVGLEKLLRTEKSIIKIYQSFILRTEQQIEELKRQIEKLEKEHNKTTEYLSSPFNSFHLVRRILIDWTIVENSLSDSLLQDTRDYMNELRSSEDFPTDEDLKKTVGAMNLISETYDINKTSFANGIVNGVQYPSQLSAHDCYVLGVESYKKDDFYNAFSWMDEALKRFPEVENPAETDIEKTLEILAYSAYRLGDLSRALDITNELLERFPNNPDAPDNIDYYIYALEDNELSKTKVKNQSTIFDSLWDVKYKGICSKAISLSVETTSQLKCRYIHNDVPFLRLAPIKEEEAFLNPRIVIFREVLYDSEIELLKELATPKMSSALVVNNEGDIGVLSKSRVGQMSWVNKDQHIALRTISQRAQDMTKLDSSSTELFQVLNYGVGGHYKSHFDFLEGPGQSVLEDGDRIATLLFYMNDVEEGGATVFTKLNVGVWPSKGAALLWYNIEMDGIKKDERTLHGACPVVAGNKWICTLWFRSKGQELRRPCELKQ